MARHKLIITDSSWVEVGGFFELLVELNFPTHPASCLPPRLLVVPVFLIYWLLVVVPVSIGTSVLPFFL